jgi:hypothetical protein
MFITRALNSTQLFEDVNFFLLSPENSRLRIGITRKGDKYTFYNSNAAIIDEMDKGALNIKLSGAFSSQIESKVLTGNGDLAYIDFRKI